MSATNEPSDVTIVSVESIIGGGKTTQLDKLKAQYKDNPNVVFLDEPIGEWEAFGLIDAMYAGSLGRCSFQMMALVSRIAKLTDAILSGAKFIVSERSPWSDFLVFARANLQGTELVGYNYAFENLQRVLETHAKITLVVAYLRVPSESAQERMMQRGRAAEMPSNDVPRVPLAYQDLLLQNHERLAQMAEANTISYHVRGQPYAKADKRMITRCKVIDGNQDVATVNEQLAAIVAEELSIRMEEETWKAMARGADARPCSHSPTSVVRDKDVPYRDLAWQTPAR